MRTTDELKALARQAEEISAERSREYQPRAEKRRARWDLEYKLKRRHQIMDWVESLGLTLRADEVDEFECLCTPGAIPTSEFLFPQPSKPEVAKSGLSVEQLQIITQKICDMAVELNGDVEALAIYRKMIVDELLAASEQISNHGKDLA